MCGACGTNGAGHWSAPFLASHAARSAAAAAVTAIAGNGIKVSAVPGGYLVSMRTGQRHPAADLGAVWETIAPGDAIGRIHNDPLWHPGVITMPSLRHPLTRVTLAVNDEIHGGMASRPGQIDARMLSSRELADRLRSLVDQRRPSSVDVIVRRDSVGHHLNQLRSHPARPYAVTEIRDRRAKANRAAHADYAGRVPTLLAWLSAMDGADDQREFKLQVPLENSSLLAIDVLRGIVTRCELLSPAPLQAVQYKARPPGGS